MAKWLRRQQNHSLPLAALGESFLLNGKRSPIQLRLAAV
jgi:hypothetical protein